MQLGTVEEIRQREGMHSIEDIFISYVERVSDIKVTGSFMEIRNHLD